MIRDQKAHTLKVHDPLEGKAALSEVWREQGCGGLGVSPVPRKGERVGTREWDFSLLVHSSLWVHKGSDHGQFVLLFLSNPGFLNDVTGKEYLRSLPAMCRLPAWVAEAAGLNLHAGGPLFNCPSSCRV